MPKIIQNAREQLLATAQKQIAERGYAATTIRSVARECGLAVGTVYNYFKSKDLLIASFMAADWQNCIQKIAACPTEDTEPFFFCVYQEISGFAARPHALFYDPAATKTFSSVFQERHRQLCGQLAALFLPLCQHANAEERDFLSRLIAESVLAFTLEGTPFPWLYAAMKKLIN